MLELIFQGFLEWCYAQTLDCWQYFSSALLDLVSLDFTYLKIHIPVIGDIVQILIAVGWALLIGNLVFQALRSMVTGLGFEAEDPKLLFTRTFIFAFLLLASPQICGAGLSMTNIIINTLQVPDAVNITFLDDGAFGGIGAAWLLVIICGVIIMFKVFRLLLEIAERYVILAFLTMTAPLAFAMGGSRSTSDIFTGWCRMFGSMCFVMVSNVIFFKMLLSALSFVPTGLDVLLWMVLVMTIVKVAKKVDAIITRIGLNPAITGDGLGGRSLPGMLTYMVIRTAASNVLKSVGKSTGDGRNGRAPSSPPGGPRGPKSGGPAGGSRFRSGASAGTDAGHARPSGQQTGAAQHSEQNASTVQAGGPQRTTQQQTAGPTVSASVRQNQSGPKSTVRKSAVPPGTPRAPSHVKAPSGMAGTPGQARGSGVSPSGRTSSPAHVSVSAPTGHYGRAGKSPAPVRTGTSGQDISSVQPGTAGKGAPLSSSRIVHNPAPGIRKDALGVDAPQEKINSSGGQSQTPRPAGTPVGMAGARQRTVPPSQSRLTHRDATVVTARSTSVQPRPADAAGSTSPAGAAQLAPVGTSAPFTSVLGTTMRSTAVAPHAPSRPSPARQEQAKAPSGAATPAARAPDAVTRSSAAAPVVPSRPSPARQEQAKPPAGAAPPAARVPGMAVRSTAAVSGASPRPASPARQEQTKALAASPPPTMRGTGVDTRPGTAGTARSGSRAADTAQAAQIQAMRAKASAAAGTGKRTVVSGPARQKKDRGKSRRSMRDGGDSHVR